MAENKDIIEIVNGISQAAANAYDGALDDKGEPLKVGLSREDAREAIIEWFKANDLYESDEILLFTDIRPESYVIPTEAEGGETILPELIDRKLYDAGLAIKAASLTEGMLCYPDLEEYAAKGKTETE